MKGLLFWVAFLTGFGLAVGHDAFGWPVIEWSDGLLGVAIGLALAERFPGRPRQTES